MKFKVKLNRLKNPGRIAYKFIEALEDKSGITFINYKEEKYIFEYIVEIDPFTESGKKAYEFIENLRNKDGITYLDLPKALTKAELKALKKEIIKILEEKQNKLYGNNSNSKQ